MKFTQTGGLVPSALVPVHIRPVSAGARVLAAGLLLWALQAQAQEKVQEKAPAAVAAPARTSAMGVTQAIRETRLSLTVPGRVEGVLVREGQRVSAGQVLLHLDRTTEELEVRRRRLLLADTARLDELRDKEKTLSGQVAALADLLDSGGVARKQFEDEEMALGAVKAERQAGEQAKQREKVELGQAIEAYERRQLRSPITGVVSKIVPRLGESVTVNEPVVNVVDVRRVRFLGTVPASVSSQVAVGRKIVLELGLESTVKTREAKVVFVSPVTDAASGLVEFIAEFDNPDGSVRPGITGRVRF